MKFGVFLPISGRAAGPDTLMEAARSAEAQGFDAVWSADRVVTPWQIHTSYPYSDNHEFIVPPDRPFLDSAAPRRSRSASACWCCPTAIPCTGHAWPPLSSSYLKVA